MPGRGPARHQVVPAVLFVLEQDGTYLLQLRRNTGVMDDLWSIPGGHVEPGEHILHTVVREAEEELGVKVEEDDIEFLGLHHYRRTDGLDGLNLYYKITRWQGEPSNADAAHCAGIEWFAADNLPDNVNPEFHEVIARKPAHFALEGQYQPRIGTLLN